VLPSDIKGMKVRPATSTIGQMVTTLGGTNVQSSAPEARDMIERGVADAITFPWGSLTLFGIDKVVTYHIDAPLYVTPFVWVLNKDKIASMSPAQKKVVDEHCTTEWAEKVASVWADFESAGRTKIGAMPGHEMVKLTPDQLDAWRKAVAPVTDQWAEGVKKAGGDPKQVLDSLRQSLVKYKSAL
jgi:TRAP-type C4-dicarboxylate transport system substrate-binding protein